MEAALFIYVITGHYWGDCDAFRIKLSCTLEGVLRILGTCIALNFCNDHYKYCIIYLYFGYNRK